MAWLIGYEQLAIASGATRRMLQHWHEERIVRPTIEAHRKLYTATEAVQIVVIAELRRQEVTMPEIRKALEPIKAELKRNAKRLSDAWLGLDPAKGTVLITPHMHTLFAAMVASRGARWCVIDIGNLVARLPQSPSADPGKAA